MVRIVPASWLKYLLIFWFVLFGSIGIIMIFSGLNNTSDSNYRLQGIIFGSLMLALPILMTLYVFTFGRARKLEISEDGINFGRKYYGPFNKKGPFDIWKGLKTNKEELVLKWNEIASIHVGQWDRWWARYSIILTSYLGDKRTTNTEAILTGLGIPARKMQYYFLTIETKKGNYYSFDLQFNLLDSAKKVIVDLGKEDLINDESYNV